MRKPFILLVLLLLPLAMAYTPNPGHSASEIGGGTFATGNFTFPSNVVVNGELNVTTLNVTSQICVGGSCGTTWSGSGGSGGGWQNTSTLVSLVNSANNVSANTLFIDNTNGYVGVGTNKPATALEVEGNTTVNGTLNATTSICLAGTCRTSWPATSNVSSASGWQNTSTTISLATSSNNVNATTLYIDNANGRVGIGSYSPSSTLYIAGNITAENFQTTTARNTYVGYGSGTSNSGTNATGLGADSLQSNTGNNVVALGYQAGYGNTKNDMFFVEQRNVNSVPLILGNFSSGDLGVGTVNPVYKLDVNGTGRFTGAVTASGGLTVTGSLSLPSGSVTNSELANNAITINNATGIAGGGSVSLGSSTTLSLTNTSVSSGAYGSASNIATFTVNGHGRLTAASSVPIAIGAGQVTSGTLGVARGGTGTSTLFTTGSLIFAASSGVYSQDNSNLYWDNSNKRLGIGTNSPNQKLQVNGAVNATTYYGDGSNLTGIQSLIKDFVVANGSVSAGDVVSYLNNGSGITKGIVSNGSVTSFTNGSAVTFNSGSSLYISASALDATHFVVVYEDSSNSGYGTAIIGTISGTSISFGSAYVFNSAATYHLSVAAVNSTAFVVAYEDSGNANNGASIVGTVSGTNISFGSESFFYTQAAATYNSVTKLDSTHVAVAWEGNGDFGRTEVGTVSGTSVSWTAEHDFTSSSGVATTYIDASALSSSSYVVSYLFNNYLYAVVCSYSGSTPTCGTASSVASGSNGIQNSVAALNSTTFVLAFRNPYASTYRGTALIGSVSGTTISWGTQYNFTLNSTQKESVMALNSTRFIVAYSDTSNGYDGMVAFGNVSGTDITFGPVKVIHAASTANSANTFYIPPVVLDSTHIALSYTDTSSSSYGTSVVVVPGGVSTVQEQSKYIGIATGSGSAGSTVPVLLNGVTDAYSGLTTGDIYYTDSSGNLTTNVSEYKVGVALSSTSLLFSGSFSPITNYDGNVGIGTNTPGYKLSVNGSIAATGTINANSGIDLAEAFTKGEPMGAGDIVAATGPNTVVKATPSIAEQTIGVVSTHPGMTLNTKGIIDPVMVALTGRVPVKVKGTVHIGDYITISNTPGVGIVATSPGFVLGRSLQNGANGTVTILVEPGYFSPQVDSKNDLIGAKNHHISGLTVGNAPTVQAASSPTLAALNATVAQLQQENTQLRNELQSLKMSVGLSNGTVQATATGLVVTLK